MTSHLRFDIEFDSNIFNKESLDGDLVFGLDAGCDGDSVKCGPLKANISTKLRAESHNF